MLVFGAEIFCNFDYTCFERQQWNRKIFMPRKFFSLKKNKSSFTRGSVKLSESFNLWQEYANYKLQITNWYWKKCKILIFGWQNFFTFWVCYFSMSTVKPQHFHATKIFALKLSNCNMTRGYLKLNESSNLLQENPIDRRNWPKLAGGTPKVPCSKICK